MTLEGYKEKRNFEVSPEPPPEREVEASGPLRFVVQKHRATNLHYDFRLELDGVLKSWAVPKGPSLNPEDKRLAMMVEDHPLDYRSFEGVIPKGNYGAGTVMVWEEGFYQSMQPGDREEQERALKQGLHKGDLKFVLAGRKLQGAFVLVHMKDRGENAWLLIKKRDEYASSEDVLAEDRSVLTGRGMEEIAAEADEMGEVWLSTGRKEAPDLSEAPVTQMPEKVKPMLAVDTDEPFDREGWLFEVKWDGYRTIAQVQGSDVRLYSRNDLEFNDRFRPLIQPLTQLGHDVVLDGEVVVTDESGKPHFELLQNYRPGREGHLIYYVFDLLHLDGHNLMGLPLSERKQTLRAILPDLPNIKFSDHVEEKGRSLFELICAQDLEGMMGKDAEAAYLPGRRTRSWLKIKTHRRQSAVIGGFTEARGSRVGLGALLLGVYEGSDLVYIGHTGTGFDDQTLVSLRKKLDALEISKAPFKEQPKSNSPAHWLKPELVCDVTFREWTNSGTMRHPVFVGLREDIEPQMVHRENQVAATSASSEEPPSESPEPSTELGDEDAQRTNIRAFAPRQKQSLPATSESQAEAGESEGEQRQDGASDNIRAFRPRSRTEDGEAITINGRKLQLTNLQKVFWPEEGYTKGDLIAYYRRVAHHILRYLVDRPESLHRHPNGIGEESFFQKNVSHKVANWIRTISIQSESESRKITYLLCQDEATLVYLANLACIELNPWSSRLGHLDNPDFAIIDLDPLDIPFEKVVEAAMAVRDVLAEANISAFCKTSGATGLHVYVPLGAKYSYEQARQFAELVAQLVHRRLPKTTSLARNPERRKKCIYLDFLQNRKGQTLAAPYSVRPKPGATVSTPLHWDEVVPSLDPAAFTIRTIPDRLEEVGDIWKPTLGKGIDLLGFLRSLA